MNLSEASIVVTGGAGFLGSYVVEALARRGYQRVFVPRSRDYDLREASGIDRLFDDVQPDVVIHLAAVVGGIGANRSQPGRFFYENAIIGIRLIEKARLANIAKFVTIGTICAYPKLAAIPFREADIWDGYPEETNAPYGLAKKMLLVQTQAYRTQYGFNGIYLLPVNLYGPRDNFDLDTSHVIPALIRKCVEAKAHGAHEVVLWGDGSPTREFLFAGDAAEGIVLATEQYEGGEPVNLGSGNEISVADLATIIAEETGFDGAIRWDSSKPNGQPRRCLDVSRAREAFGFEARTSFRDGLRETIRWYLDHTAGLEAAAASSSVVHAVRTSSAA